MLDVPSLEPDNSNDPCHLSNVDHLRLASLENQPILRYVSDDISMTRVVEVQVGGNEHTLTRMDVLGNLQIEVVTATRNHSPRLFSQSRSVNDDSSLPTLQRRNNPRN
jgi:hypothetical protein